MLQESIHSVGKLAPVLFAFQIVVTAGGSEKQVAIWTPVKPSNKRLVLNIVQEQPMRCHTSCLFVFLVVFFVFYRGLLLFLTEAHICRISLFR